MFKYKCLKCGVVPKTGWWLASETSDKLDHFYCDECVPRGCSCNQELKEGIDWESEEAKDPNNYFEKLDDKGRKWPCCEYFWSENEFSEEQRIC